MTRTPIAALLLAAATAAHAGDPVFLAKPMAGATLHSEAADMSVYWIAADAGYDVTAVYLPQDGTGPRQLRMLLADGDAVRFGLPGLPGTVYEFAGRDGGVTVSGMRTWTDLARN